MEVADIVRERTSVLVRPGPERPGASEGTALRDVRLAELYFPCPHCRRLGADRAGECRNCGVIFAKWRRRPAPAPAMPAAAARPRVRVSIRIAAGAFAFALALAAFSTPSPDFGQPNYVGKVAQAGFDAKVLQSATPVLVMFDIAPQCGCAESELRELSRQWNGKIGVVTMNAVDSPELGAKYGDPKDAIVLLFKDGRLVKRADAAEMERAIMSRHGGKYDSGEMKSALEDFVRNV